MQRGFSLVEAIVAMAIMSTATIAVAQLSILSARANRLARSNTMTTVLASQRLEQLQSAAWAELTPSPPEALLRSTDGYVDYLDANGRTLGGGRTPPRGAVFVRRWTITRIAAGDALMIQVSVVSIGAAEHVVADPGPHQAEETRLAGIKRRA
jgi:prepilin-type N-terminal cleavage/methylation domain-containing protein